MDQVEGRELNYFSGDDLAANAWRTKYALPSEQDPNDMHIRMANEFGKIEADYYEREYQDTCHPNQTKLKYLSKYGQNRKWLDEEGIYDMFKRFKYIIPQGSIMSMLGADKIGSLSNCFVVGQPEDSYGGILQKDQQLAQLMKRRGGVGIDISTLRPTGTTVTNTAGTSTGAVSFMHRFSNTTREVAQNGRRGALMITIDCRHPDVFEFVNIKQDLTKVTGANISVMLRDDFMEAVKKDEDYILRFPCDSKMGAEAAQAILEFDDIPYNVTDEVLENDKPTGIYLRKIKAKELYDSIVDNAHANAEPGQMFIDRHHEYSPDSVYEQYRGVTTNPCGEIFMQAYDACRLMALNLLSFVDNPFTKDASVNWVKLYEMAYEQQRLADDLVDLELEHISRILAKVHSDDQPQEVKQAEIDLWEKVFDTAKGGRRTGCGFTALGDMLAALGVAYDSDAGLDYIQKVMHTKMEGELDCSIDLAILRGPFEGWDVNKEFLGQSSGSLSNVGVLGNNEFYQMIEDEYPEQSFRMQQHGRRNISTSTVAPTGTTSMVAQTSAGIEPVFGLKFIRRKKVNPGDEGVRVDFVDENGDSWTEYPIMHPQFRRWYEEYRNYLVTEGYDDEFIDTDYHELLLDTALLDCAIEASPWFGSCAPDIDWKKRVEIQALVQKYTSHSISSTINLPENVTKAEVGEIYLHSYEQGLKGVTVYREGSRSGVLIRDKKEETDEFEYRDAPKRPTCLRVEIHSTVSKGVKWNVLVGLFNGKPYEVFAVPHFTNVSSADLCKVKRGQYDLVLPTGEALLENVTSIIETPEEAVLTRIISTSLRHGADITFIVEQLNKSTGDITSFSKAIGRVLRKYADVNKVISRTVCQECNSTEIVMEEGCMTCKSCGNSKCG